MNGSAKRPSVFANAAYIPPDSIFDVTRRYVADECADKVNLGQGTYRDGQGKPWVLPSVRQAEDLLRDSGHEYLPISGWPLFRDAATKLAFHGSKALEEDRVRIAASVHCVVTGVYAM